MCIERIEQAHAWNGAAKCSGDCGAAGGSGAAGPDAEAGASVMVAGAAWTGIRPGPMTRMMMGRCWRCCGRPRWCRVAGREETLGGGVGAELKVGTGTEAKN